MCTWVKNKYNFLFFISFFFFTFRRPFSLVSFVTSARVPRTPATRLAAIRDAAATRRYSISNRQIIVNDYLKKKKQLFLQFSSNRSRVRLFGFGFVKLPMRIFTSLTIILLFCYKTFIVRTQSSIDTVRTTCGSIQGRQFSFSIGMRTLKSGKFLFPLHGIFYLKYIKSPRLDKVISPFFSKSRSSII